MNSSIEAEPTPPGISRMETDVREPWFDSALKESVRPEHLFLAWELSQWREGADGRADERQSRAFRRLLVALLEAMSSGSTHLELPPRPAAFLKDRVAAWGLPAEEGQAVMSLSRTLNESLFSSLVTEPTRGARMTTGRPLVLQDGRLFTHRYYQLEASTASALQNRLSSLRSDDGPSREDSAWIASAVHDVTKTPPHLGSRPMRLTKEQQTAVTAAVRDRFTVITGGPGTGKTSIVLSILRVLARGPRETFAGQASQPAALGGMLGGSGEGFDLSRVALCAPTGRAADRMRRSVEDALRRLRAPSFADLRLLRELPSATTMHRLLAYSPRQKRFRHHRDNPLAQRFLIVDECSMVDLAMMERFLSAVPPDAQVVLLGDADQLPSVDAGAVFRDLVALRIEGKSPARRLKRSFRMDPSNVDGRQILLTAQAVKAGKREALFSETGEALVKTGSAASLDFRGVAWVPASDRDALLERMWQRIFAQESRSLRQRRYHLRDGRFDGDDHERLEALFQLQDEVRMLCPFRRGSLGVLAINQWFQGRLRSRSGEPGEFLVGEPILVERNDYGKGLFNGDQGVVLRVVDEDAAGSDERGTKMAVFRRGGRFEAFSLASLQNNISLAYAMTVHKAQGSEYQEVVITVPPSDGAEGLGGRVVREVLYTALTRARTGAVLLGDKEALLVAIAQEDGRRTALSTHVGV